MQDYDVAVIGLGAMGSSALFHLARRGVKAVGIERFTPGHDRGSSHGESRAIRLGYFEHPSYVPLVKAAYAGWRELERLSGEALLTITGILEASTPDGRLVAGTLESCLLHGLEHELLTAAEVIRRFPAISLPAHYTAIWEPEGGFLHADLANAVHLRLAREAGAAVMTERRVSAIEPGVGGVELRLDGETVRAATVVVAAGPWIGDLVPELKPHLFVQRQVLCWYRPKEPKHFALGALPVFAVESEDDIVYGFPDFAGTGCKCGSHFGSGILPHADAARQDAGAADEARTRRFLERFVPEGAGELIGMKTCLYTMTPDEDFVIDLSPADPRIVVASPCSGHGYKFASVIGEILADLATVRATRHDISRFRIARFQP